MFPDHLVDRGRQWLKRWQRRVYYSDYGDARLRDRWLERPEDAPYREQTYAVLPDLDAVRTVLVFKPDEIGDAVQALPALVELRARLPKAQLFLLCHEKTAGLFARTGCFDGIAPVGAPTSLLGFSRLRLSAALRRLPVRDFDLSLFLRTYPAFFPAFLAVPSRARYHPRDPRLPSRSLYQAPVPLWGDRRAHAALQLLELVAPLTGKRYRMSDIRYPAFQWNDEDRRAESIVFPDGTPPRFLVAHPFAKLETKRYPAAYWETLLARVQREKQIPIVVIGGKEDPALPSIPGVVGAQGKLSLTQTGYLLSRASAFLGNESGPGHLASALAVPTLTLMGGHSYPTEWAPLDVQGARRSLVLRADVPCAPCHRRTCAGYGLACLTALTPERVWPAVDAFLDETAR